MIMPNTSRYSRSLMIGRERMPFSGLRVAIALVLWTLPLAQVADFHRLTDRYQLHDIEDVLVPVQALLADNDAVPVEADAVDRQDHVAGLQPGSLEKAMGQNLRDDDAPGPGLLKQRIEVLGVLLQLAADTGEARLVLLQQVFDDDFHEARRRDETDVLAVRQHGRVQADDLAVLR
jgi:hypothetical protein